MNYQLIYTGIALSEYIYDMEIIFNDDILNISMGRKIKINLGDIN